MDLLVRDVPEEVLRALDARAARAGISRGEYLRRRLFAEAMAAAVPVTVADLARLAEDCTDLADEQVMGRAWG